MLGSMFNAILPVVALIVGLLMWVMGKSETVQTIGKIWFAEASLVILAVSASHMVKLPFG
jgi:hypothetical protein